MILFAHNPVDQGFTLSTPEMAPTCSTLSGARPGVTHIWGPAGTASLLGGGWGVQECSTFVGLGFLTAWLFQGPKKEYSKTTYPTVCIMLSTVPLAKPRHVDRFRIQCRK